MYDELEQSLKGAKFEYKRGWNGKRREMTLDGRLPKIMFFTNWRKTGLSKDSSRYPEIREMCREIAKANFPEFEYNIIQINKNVGCKPHRDGANTGESMIFTVGDYNGGRLIIEDECFDINRKPKRFDGARLLHSTEDFEGERFAVIYYQSNISRGLE